MSLDKYPCSRFWKIQCHLMVQIFYSILLKCRELSSTMVFNPIQDGPFGGCSEICHTHPTLMKLGTVIAYLREIQKLHESLVHPLISADINIFWPKISNFSYIRNFRYRLHFNEKYLDLLTFLESLRVILVNVIELLIMSAKVTTLDLLKKIMFEIKNMML